MILEVDFKEQTVELQADFGEKVEYKGSSYTGTGKDAEVFNGGKPEQASGDHSHAEGYRTKASGDRGHAEGDSTEAGWRSHAEGFLTLANNTSHAGGRLAKATGKGSFAHGVETYSVPGGKYFWAEDMSLDSVTFSVYDADDSNVNNYLSVGDYIRLAPDGDFNPVTDCRKVVGISGDGKTITIDYPFGDVNYTTPFTGGYYVEVAVGCLADAYGAHAEGYSASAIGGKDVHAPHAEGKLTKASATGAHAEGNNTTASGFASHAEGNASQATNTSAHAEGYSTTASGTQSHAEGARTVASGSNSHAEGADTLASGEGSHSEGKLTTAANTGAHAEGNKTVSSGFASHAEGNASKATNTSAHAEGFNTTASGVQSHAEGARTVASGSNSHAEGSDTIAKGDAQHAQGKFNIEDTANKYAHIVGNGTSDTARSNAHTVDWNGNGWFLGDVYVGGSGQDDVNAEKLARLSDLKPKLVETIKKLTSSLHKCSVGFEMGKRYRIDFLYGNIQYSVELYTNPTKSAKSGTFYALFSSSTHVICNFNISYSSPDVLGLQAISFDGTVLQNTIYGGFADINIYELPY